MEHCHCETLEELKIVIKQYGQEFSTEDKLNITYLQMARPQCPRHFSVKGAYQI